MNLRASLGLECAVTDAVRSRTALTPEIRASARSCSKPKHDLAGYSSTRIILEFARWAFERDAFPTVGDIVHRFNVSRATAYRWRNELGQALRMSELPPNDPAGRVARCESAPADAALSGGPGR